MPVKAAAAELGAIGSFYSLEVRSREYGYSEAESMYYMGEEISL